jgi:hypothetical protein
MGITTLDGYIASPKQLLSFTKTASLTTVAVNWSTIFHLAGNPGAGTLNVGNTANGLVPTDATTGFPGMNAFSGANLGYLSRLQFGWSVAGRLLVYDRLFHAGAYAFNANVTLASQPSFSSRVPGGTNFGGLEIWIEIVTAMTGALACTVGYTDQSGNTGASTGAFSIPSGAILGRMFKMPLAAGDWGVQQVNTVLGATASAGTFNILVIRPLAMFRVPIVGSGDVYGLDKTGMPQIWADSALQVAVCTDSTSSGIPEVLMEISEG